MILFYFSLTPKYEYTSFETSLSITEHQLGRIQSLVREAIKGEYHGTSKKRHGKNGLIPIWNQRTALLHYNKDNVGEPIIWLALSMGVVGNAKELVSNKRTWTDVWMKANPTEFPRVDVYLPKTWSDVEAFSKDMNEDDIYVYKPVYGYQGRGITFRKGLDMNTQLMEEEGSDWVVQEFIKSFLYNGKKNHIRVVSLIIVQPDGSREFFVYKRMRLYTAPENYDEERLLGDGDVSNMLLTNLRQNEVYFKSDPSNTGKDFSPRECVLDTQTVLENSDSGISFDHVFLESKKMHEAIYSVIRNTIECKPTDVSIYDDACFHMMASDVSFDGEGKPHLLEMNHRMGFNILWTPEEQFEFSNGIASLVKGTGSPYSVEESLAWEKLDV